MKLNISTSEFKRFDRPLYRNPVDMAEGGDVQDTSTRLEYLATARKMKQPPLPMPVNKAVLTSFQGLAANPIPMFKPSNLTTMDINFYSGLLNISSQPKVNQASSFATSGTPKGESDL